MLNLVPSLQLRNTYPGTKFNSLFNSGPVLSIHRRMGLGEGGGGLWRAAGPPKFGQLRFFGQEEKFGLSQFLKKF